MTTPLEAALELAPQVRERWDHAALECEGECVHGSLTTRAEVWAEFGPLLAAVEHAEQEIGRLREALEGTFEELGWHEFEEVTGPKLTAARFRAARTALSEVTP